MLPNIFQYLQSSSFMHIFKRNNKYWISVHRTDKIIQITRYSKITLSSFADSEAKISSDVVSLINMVHVTQCHCLTTCRQYKMIRPKRFCKAIDVIFVN